MKALPLLFALLLVPAQEEKKAPAYDEPGPLKVETKEFKGLKDRRRDLPIKAHYPDAKGPFPLVVISHGGAGNWDANKHQAKHLASHGYVVLCTTHPYSNARRVRYYMSRAGGG
ncbi:MAG: alpha/beta hydrolase family protein, partial [Planctomycetota bacterium]